MAGSLVIAAIPDENDRVWKVSSEKVPHLTLLYLGEDADQVQNVDQIMLFVEHAANTTLRRFYLPVDRRGELGDDKADVLFFKKGRYDYKAVRDFRAQLLQNTSIKTAYDSSKQFEGPWNPHLTLGYPDTPAKPDENDYPFYDVSFNKVAVWTGDYEGPEFLLKDYFDEYEALETVPMDVAMSNIQHYGVKGMKWGVRSERGGSSGQRTSNGLKSVGKALAKAADDVGFEAVKETDTIYEDITNKAHERLVRDLPGIKAKHGDYAKLRNRVKKPFSQEAQAYRKDVKDTYLKHLEESANELTNIQGTRRYTLKDQGKPNTSKYFWEISTEEIEHASTTVMVVQPIFDEEGWIVDIKPVKDEMAQTAELGAEFLAHYGVKGMRWGVRNADRPMPTAVPVSARSVVPSGTKRKTKIETEGGENHDASQDAIKVAQAKTKLQKSGTAALSNAELREVANRLQLEQQVKQLTQPKTQRFVTNLLKTQGNQAVNQLVGQQVRRGLRPRAA